MMSNKPVVMMSDAVLYIHIKAYTLQLHIHNAKAEESSAGKKI